VQASTGGVFKAFVHRKGGEEEHHGKGRHCEQPGHVRHVFSVTTLSEGHSNLDDVQAQLYAMRRCF
jgi:hypothetical protein